MNENEPTGNQPSFHIELQRGLNTRVTMGTIYVFLAKKYIVLMSRISRYAAR